MSKNVRHVIICNGQTPGKITEWIIGGIFIPYSRILQSIKHKLLLHATTRNILINITGREGTQKRMHDVSISFLLLYNNSPQIQWLNIMYVNYLLVSMGQDSRNE